MTPKQMIWTIDSIEAELRGLETRLTLLRRELALRFGIESACPECEGRGYIEQGEGCVSTACPVCRP